MLVLDRVSVNTSSVATSTGQERAFKLLLGGGVDLDLESEQPIDLGGDVTTDALWLANRHPQSAAAQARLAQAFLATRSIDDTRRTALRSGHLAVNQKDIPALVVSAATLVAIGDWGHAEEILSLTAGDQATRVYWAACAVQRRDWSQALARLGDLDDFESSHMAAWIALQQRDFQTAIRNFRAAMRYDDPSPDLMVDLGFAYASIGARRKAERTTSIAVRMAPHDLRAGFNLVTFRTAIRDYEGAFKELDRLQTVVSNDLRVPMAKASLYQLVGEPSRAQRELQIVMASQRFWSADPLQKEELRAMESMIGFDSGRLSRDDLISRLEKAIDRTEARSMLIGQGLANVYSTSRRNAAKLRTLIEQMATIHPQEALYAPMARLAIAEHDYDSAVDLSRRWLEYEPFNVWAGAQSTYVLISLAQYEDAAKLGTAFLTRVDDRALVLNNTAYALAMLGDQVRARDLLKKAEKDSPEIVATRALIDLLSGNIDEGRTGYLKAAQLAEQNGQVVLAVLVRIKLEKVLASLGIEPDTKIEVPEELRDDPRFELIELEATLQEKTRT